MIVFPIITNWMELIECYRRLLTVVCAGGITWFPIEEKCGKETLLVSYITIIWPIMKEAKMYWQDYKNYVDKLYLDQLFPVKIILIISS